MSSILHLWDAIVESVALIIIVVTAVGMMLGMVEVPHAFKRIALVLGCVVLLQMLPPMIVNVWNTLSPWQHLGVTALFGSAATTALLRGKTRKNTGKPRN